MPVLRNWQSKNKEAQAEYEILTMLKETFENELPARTIEFNEEQQKIVRGFQLLTMKPVLYVANIGEDDVANANKNKYVQVVQDFAEKDHAEVVVICARIEEEIAELEPEEKAAFLQELGIQESGLDQMIRKAYHLLGLATFLLPGFKRFEPGHLKKE